MKKQTIIALKLLLIMTVLTGIIYPLVMTGLVQLTNPVKANGSMLMKNGKIIGSVLLGQKFDSSIYFWSRPSAIAYNPVPSGASNYGPTSDTLKKLVAARRLLFAKLNSIQNISDVPEEMICASGSGLDPHISPLAALLQVDRVTKARNFNSAQKQKLTDLIHEVTEKPQFGLFGGERINVLVLNIRLDEIK
jgi:potassium-transporting ATPase KdpC subunit